MMGLLASPTLGLWVAGLTAKQFGTPAGHQESWPMKLDTTGVLAILIVGRGAVRRNVAPGFYWVPKPATSSKAGRVG